MLSPQLRCKIDISSTVVVVVTDAFGIARNLVSLSTLVSVYSHPGNLSLHESFMVCVDTHAIGCFLYATHWNCDTHYSNLYYVNAGEPAARA